MTEKQSLSVEQLRLMLAYARFSLAKGMCFLSIGVAAIVTANLLLEGVTLLHIATAAGLVLLIAGGFADGDPLKAGRTAGTILILQLLAFAIHAVSGDQAAKPAIEGLESVLVAVTPMFEVLPSLFAAVAGLIGIGHLVLAGYHIRRLTQRIAEREGSSIVA